jgi:hypothetical protein
MGIFLNFEAIFALNWCKFMLNMRMKKGQHILSIDLGGNDLSIIFFTNFTTAGSEESWELSDMLNMGRT